MARVTTAATTSGSLPRSWRAPNRVVMDRKASAYSARAAGSNCCRVAAASLSNLPPASVRIFPGSIRTTRIRQGASSKRSASVSASSACLLAASGPMNGGVRRSAIELIMITLPASPADQWQEGLRHGELAVDVDLELPAEFVERH